MAPSTPSHLTMLPTPHPPTPSLQVVLPYEGADFTPLARVSATAFAMTVDSFAQGGVDMGAKLGNVEATYEVGGGRIGLWCGLHLL